MADVRNLGRGGALLKALGAVRAGRVSVSARGTLGGLTQFPILRVNCCCKLLILKIRRDVRVVEGARLESETGDHHQAIPKHLVAQSVQQLPATRCSSV